jgi:hypothetical protein
MNADLFISGRKMNEWMNEWMEKYNNDAVETLNFVCSVCEHIIDRICAGGNALSEDKEQCIIKQSKTKTKMCHYHTYEQINCIHFLSLMLFFVVAKCFRYYYFLYTLEWKTGHKLSLDSRKDEITQASNCCYYKIFIEALIERL